MHHAHIRSIARMIPSNIYVLALLLLVVGSMQLAAAESSTEGDTLIEKRSLPALNTKGYTNNSGKSAANLQPVAHDPVPEVSRRQRRAVKPRPEPKRKQKPKIAKQARRKDMKPGKRVAKRKTQGKKAVNNRDGGRPSA